MKSSVYIVSNVEPSWVDLGECGCRLWRRVGPQTRLVRPSGHETVAKTSPRQHLGLSWALISRFGAALGAEDGAPLRLEIGPRGPTSRLRMIPGATLHQIHDLIDV